MDGYHAECVPCGWLEVHEIEQDAIDAVEKHIALYHPLVRSFERLQKTIGHVQMRTVMTPAPPPPVAETLAPTE